MPPDPRRVASRFLTGTLTMKKTGPTLPGSLQEFRALVGKGREVGRVYKRRTTKEVFRAGRLMTVPVLGWFYRITSESPEVGAGPTGPRWVEMAEGVEALAVAVR